MIYRFTKGTPEWVKPLLIQASQKYGIPTEVLSSVAKAESGFNPQSKQSGGLGRGLFQLDLGQQPVTEQQAFDPVFATNYAAQMLKNGYDRNGSWYNSAREYNGGPNYTSNAIGWAGKTVNQNTLDYADKVNGFLNDLEPYNDRTAPTMPNTTVNNYSNENPIMRFLHEHSLFNKAYAYNPMAPSFSPNASTPQGQRYVSPLPSSAEYNPFSMPQLNNNQARNVPNASTAQGPRYFPSPVNYSAVASNYNSVPSYTPYTVKPGDTLWGLAQKYTGNGSNWRNIQGFGGNPHQLPVGQQLYLPKVS